MSLELPKASSDIQNHVKGLLFRQAIEGLLARIQERYPPLKNAFNQRPGFYRDPVDDTAWFGLWSRPGQDRNFLGFRLTLRGQPDYPMEVDIKWPNPKGCIAAERAD